MASALFTDYSPATDTNDNPLSGATWKFYATGTTTPQAVYADADLGVSLGATVTADSAGKFAPFWLDTSKLYRAILADADGAEIYDIDPVNGKDPLSRLASIDAGEGGALISNIVIPVASRTALKAVSTTRYQHASLGESGRQGLFMWNSADLSAEVTADVDEVRYVAPNADATGASGAWVRQASGQIKMSWAGTLTAQKLETLANVDWDEPLTGSGSVETAAYPTRTGLSMRDVTLGTTNATSLSTNDYHNVPLALGFMAGQVTYGATKYTVSALSDDKRTLTLGAGEGDNFAAGDVAFVFGTTKYDSGSLRFPRAGVWSRVISKTGNTITIDHGVPIDIEDDDPILVINAGSYSTSGLVSGDRTPANFHCVQDWTLTNCTIESETSDAWKWGGVLNGKFSDIRINGRHGISLNALQDCTFDRVTARWWRGSLELAQNSRGTTVRNYRGWQEDPSTKYGGGSDQGTFIWHLGENSRDCLIDGAIDHATFCNASANAIILSSGVNNRIVNSTVHLPRYLGSLIGISTNQASNPVERCGIENSTFVGGASAQYFGILPVSGVQPKQCFVRNCTFKGAVTARAALIQGTDGGEVIGNNFEFGGLLFNGTTEGWRIEDNYIPDGFESLTNAILKKNTIRNNESDASRRIMAAAHVSRTVEEVTTAVANTAYATMTIAPGDLAEFDQVFARIEGYGAGDTGSNNRHIRVTLDMWDGSPVELIDLVETAYTGAWWIDVKVNVLGNTSLTSFVRAESTAGPKRTYGNLNAGDLATNGLEIVVEIWNNTAPVTTVVTDIAIAGQKAGFRNVPVFLNSNA